MRRARALLALLAVTAAAFAEAPQKFNLALRESLVVPVFGATAAFAVDPTIIDASATNGTVMLFGRSAGTTHVTIVTIAGQATYEVTVAGPRVLTPHGATRGATEGRLETRYTSSGRQLRNSVDLVREQPGRRTEAHAETVHHGTETGSRASTELAAVSYRIFTGKREWTLFDRTVDHSPLTLTSTTVRGLHFVGERWRAHAGTTAYATYKSFLLPSDRRTVLGLAYAHPLNASSRLTPSLFVYPDRDDTVASLLYDYARGDRFAARAELAFSNGLGGATQLAYDTGRDHLRLDVRYRPRRFASVTPGETRGLFGDAAWSHTFGRGSTVDTSISAIDFDLPGLRQRAVSAGSNARLRITERASFLGGVSYGSFNETRSITVPAGVQFDTRRFGVTALVRWAQSSATNRGGAGFRIATRMSAGRVFGSAYADYQQQAPTLALIFREQPELALALAQLGITATTPEDIARALRENSALVELGFIEGVTVELAPARTQAGLELAWLGASTARPQVRARVLMNRVESVATRTDTVIATLSASRRLTGSTDIFATYTHWLTKRRGQNEVVQPVLEAGFRLYIDQLPSFLSRSRGTIEGTVYADDDLDGVPEGGVANAEIQLDGAAGTRSASDGTFSFRGISAGTHRLVARIPHAPEAFFTTPSHLEAKTGGRVRFGVAFTPARVLGRLSSDSGDGIASVRVSLTRGPSRVEATTGSDGTFGLAAAPGEWDLAVDVASLPAGYSMEAASQSVALGRATPIRVVFSAHANRSISGIAPAGVSSIEAQPLGLRVPVGSDRRFTIRSLPAGVITLRAGHLSRDVTLSNEPAVITDVVFEDVPAATASLTGFIVQLGAYRDRENATDIVERARRGGVRAVVITGRRLTFVRTGPFSSREAANAVLRQLAQAGIDAQVVRVR